MITELDPVCGLFLAVILAMIVGDLADTLFRQHTIGADGPARHPRRVLAHPSRR